MNYQRTKNALLGLAAGDALSWQALYHKSYNFPFWTRRLRREIDVESESVGILKPNLPFSLNIPTESFKISPTDDSEWAAFISQILIQNEGVYNFDSHIKAWKELAEDESQIKGSVAVIAALNNFKKNMMPPVTGNDNPHYFDDSSMVRAIPIGAIYAGDIDKAVECAGLEASITNSLDGIWAAQSIAAAISTACVETEIEKIISAALQPIPTNSWLYLKINEALKISKKYKSVFSALPVLHDEIIDHTYNYGSSAPDNLALTLALFVLSGGNISVGITAAASLAKTADSVPAFVGALCGTMNNEPFEEEWVKNFTRLNGICIPSLKGKNLNTIAEQLNQIAETNLDK